MGERVLAQIVFSVLLSLCTVNICCCSESTGRFLPLVAIFGSAGARRRPQVQVHAPPATFYQRPFTHELVKLLTDLKPDYPPLGVLNPKQLQVLLADKVERFRGYEQQVRRVQTSFVRRYCTTIVCEIEQNVGGVGAGRRECGRGEWETR